MNKHLAKTQSGHTPTPWQKECSLFREENISIGIFRGDDLKNEIASWHGLTRHDAEKVHANVDLIVRAVNAHEEMLGMLYANASAWDDEEDSVKSEHRELILRLKALIAKVEGK